MYIKLDVFQLFMSELKLEAPANMAIVLYIFDKSQLLIFPLKLVASMNVPPNNVVPLKFKESVALEFKFEISILD